MNYRITVREVVEFDYYVESETPAEAIGILLANDRMNRKREFEHEEVSEGDAVTSLEELQETAHES